jgi:2-keto-3-deoxy-L-rhamnonate aldolase RhmA
MIETVEGLQNIEHRLPPWTGSTSYTSARNDPADRDGLNPALSAAPSTSRRLDRIFAATRAHGKIPAWVGDRNVERQAAFIRKGARFITTNSDIAFMMAEASRVTGALRQALDKSAAA